MDLQKTRKATDEEIGRILTINELKEGFILGAIPKDAKQDEELTCILYKNTIIAAKKRQEITSDWVHQEIRNYKVKEGLINIRTNAEISSA